MSFVFSKCTRILKVCAISFALGTIALIYPEALEKESSLQLPYGIQSTNVKTKSKFFFIPTTTLPQVALVWYYSIYC